MTTTKIYDEKELNSLPIIGRKPKNEKEENYLREICEFEFINLETPGLSIQFPYGNSSNRLNFKFFHGGKYLIPRHVARHLENCTTPLWDWRPNGLGNLEKKLISNKSRFQMRQTYGS